MTIHINSNAIIIIVAINPRSLSLLSTIAGGYRRNCFFLVLLFLESALASISFVCLLHSHLHSQSQSQSQSPSLQYCLELRHLFRYIPYNVL